jgi:hypothetical protein
VAVASMSNSCLQFTPSRLPRDTRTRDIKAKPSCGEESAPASKTVLAIYRKIPAHLSGHKRYNLQTAKKEVMWKRGVFQT